MLVPLLVAAGGGVAWGLCFGKVPSSWLGAVALVPLCALVFTGGYSVRRLALLGFVHGWTSWVVQLPWIPPTIETFGNVPPIVAWGLLALAAAYLGLYHAAFAAFCAAVPRRWISLNAAAAWVVLEWLRGNALGSLRFPWNLAAYAWVDLPGVLPLAAWVGAYGVSALVVATNAALAAALLRRRWTAAAAVVLGVGALLFVAARFSRPESPASSPQRVRLLQPNQAMSPPGDGADVHRNYAAMILAAESECRGEPTLLVLPESAAWPHHWEGSWQLRRDLGRLAGRGCWTIFNTPLRSDGEAYTNSALLVGPGGPAGRYDKRYLVPWGEHVPLADVLPFVGKLARHAGSFAAGKEITLLPWLGEELGLLICYEVVFPEAVTAEVRSGASLLVNISNDAWYGDSSAPYQLFRAARFRAAESRRPLLRAALTGISGVIGPRGEVRSRLGLFERDVLRDRIAGSRERTPYHRAPWLVPSVCMLLTAFAIFLARPVFLERQRRYGTKETSS